jgi:hypothetical protein
MKTAMMIEVTCRISEQAKQAKQAKFSTSIGHHWAGFRLTMAAMMA